MKFFRILLPFLWMALIFYLSSKTDLPRADTYFLEFLFKKSGHVFVYFVLCLLWFFALGSKEVEKAVLYTLLYAFTDEIHQLFVPGRTGALTDILIDSLGISLAVFTNYLILWKRSTLPPAQKKLKK